MAAAYVGFAVVGGLLSFVDDYLCTWVGERFVLNLRTSLFAHLHRMSLGFFERRQLGDLMSRLTSDVNAIEQLVLSGVMQADRAQRQDPVFGGLLFVLNWRLAPASLVAAPLFRWHRATSPAASRPPRARSAGAPARSVPSPRRASATPRSCRPTTGRRGDQRFHTENLGAFAAQMVATRLRATFGPFVDLLETAAVCW